MNRIKRPYLLASLFVLLVVAVGAMIVSSQSMTEHRTTREELARSASQSNASNEYDYYFSEEELATVKSAVKPYNCGYGKKMTAQEEYSCGVTSVFMIDTFGFIPAGYMYYSALYRGDGLVGIRMVKTAGWTPSQIPAPLEEVAPPPDSPGVYIPEPTDPPAPKSTENLVPLPEGKPPVPNVDPGK